VFATFTIVPGSIVSDDPVGMYTPLVMYGPAALVQMTLPEICPEKVVSAEAVVQVNKERTIERAIRVERIENRLRNMVNITQNYQYLPKMQVRGGFIARIKDTGMKWSSAP
jgi:hypothetical protein